MTSLFLCLAIGVVPVRTVESTIPHGSAGGAIHVRIDIDRTTMRLADDLLVTLTIEAAAPLTVELPALWIQDRRWATEELPPDPRERRADGRDVWVRRIRLSPRADDPALPILVAPVQVTAGNQPKRTIEWPGGLKVEVTVKRPAATVGNLHPETDAEDPPPVESPKEPSILPGVSAAIVGGLLLLFAVLRLCLFRRHEAPAEEINADWVARQLQECPNDFDRHALVVRQYLAVRTGRELLPCTTSELIAAVSDVSWLGGRDELRTLAGVLSDMDRRRFQPSGLQPEISNESIVSVVRSLDTLARSAAESIAVEPSAAGSTMNAPR